MSDLIVVQGVILSAMPVGEYDRRIVLLTKERGKISVFAKGARRPNSPFLAASGAFVFGRFTLYEGRSSYNLNHAEVTHHFAELAGIWPGVYYGYYFLELADYFGREGQNEEESMNLLFVTVKALLSKRIPDRLIRCIFELRMMVIQGMMPGLTECTGCGREIGKTDGEILFSQEDHGICEKSCAKREERMQKISSSALYAMRFIVSVPLQKLYSFTVNDTVLSELENVIHTYVRRNTDREFKTLAILEMMDSK